MTLPHHWLMVWFHSPSLPLQADRAKRRDTITNLRMGNTPYFRGILALGNIMPCIYDSFMTILQKSHGQPCVQRIVAYKQRPGRGQVPLIRAIPYLVHVAPVGSEGPTTNAVCSFIHVALNSFQGLLLKMLKRVQYDRNSLRRQPFLGLAAEVDGGFERVGGLEQGFLAKIVGEELQAQREAILVEARRQ